MDMADEADEDQKQIAKTHSITSAVGQLNVCKIYYRTGGNTGAPRHCL
jgi:hypothetical protein